MLLAVVFAQALALAPAPAPASQTISANDVISGAAIGAEAQTVLTSFRNCE